jgi:hypothetical protein
MNGGYGVSAMKVDCEWRKNPIIADLYEKRGEPGMVPFELFGVPLCWLRCERLN